MARKSALIVVALLTLACGRSGTWADDPRMLPIMPGCTPTIFWAERFVISIPSMQ
jgi:hypothetical protein